MHSREDWDAAVEAGLVGRAEAEALAAFLAARAARPHDAEEVRFARGFHDVFLTIGVVILLAGATFGGLLAAGIPFGLILPAALAWALAEVFARRRRLVLPSIALATAFAVLCGAAVTSVYAIATDLAATGASDLPIGWTERTMGLVGVGGGILAALAFYGRFRLPFSLGLIALGFVVGTAVVDLWTNAGSAAASLDFLVVGLLIFAAAMAFDMRDPARQTLDTDKAFWLHLVAAPVIVHSMIGLLGVESRFTLDARGAAIVFAVVVVLAVVALAVDRRALLVAGLGYLGFAIAVLLEGATVSSDAVIAVSLLLLGLVVVALGAGWRQARRGVLALIPSAALKARLPAAS